MSYDTTICLRCSNCNARGFQGESDEPLDEVRTRAIEAGWIGMIVPNGSFWDYCPRCVALGKHQVVEPNGICQWCDVPHGGHQAECPAGERDEARAEVRRLKEHIRQNEQWEASLRPVLNALVNSLPYDCTCPTTPGDGSCPLCRLDVLLT